MTGISEVLVLILLICGILILPRMLKPAPKSAAGPGKPGVLGMKMRAGIVVSLIFPILTALVMKPWQDGLILYLSIGVLPVALAWGLAWILAAQRR